MRLFVYLLCYAVIIATVVGFNVWIYHQDDFGSRAKDWLTVAGAVLLVIVAVAVGALIAP